MQSKIRLDLERFYQRTRSKPEVLYDFFNVVLYVLRTGSYGGNFPKWYPVYDYFRMWSKLLFNAADSLSDLLWKRS